MYLILVLLIICFLWNIKLKNYFHLFCFRLVKTMEIWENSMVPYTSIDCDFPQSSHTLNGKTLIELSSALNSLPKEIRRFFDFIKIYISLCLNEHVHCAAQGEEFQKLLPSLPASEEEKMGKSGANQRTPLFFSLPQNSSDSH